MIDTLRKEGISTKYIIEDESCFTTLAFVEINLHGEREFYFARKPGADTRLCKTELDYTLLKSCKIFHYGSLSLTDKPAREATLEAIHIAKCAGAMISYDPNYRASLWNDENYAIGVMKSVITYADIIKISDEESRLLTGEKECGDAMRKLLQMGPKVIAITLGSELLRNKELLENIPWEKLKQCARFGNATAALCVQKRGGIPSIPTKEQVEKLICQSLS